MQHQFAEVVRVHAVGILGRVDHVDDRVLVDALGQRQLDDEPGAGRIFVEFAYGSGDVVEAGVRRQFLLD